MDDDGRSVWGRPAFLVSAVLLVAVLALGLWVALSARGDDDAPAAGPTTPASPTATATASPAVTETATAAPEEPTGTPGDGAGEGDGGEDGDAADLEPSVCGLGPAEADGTVVRPPDDVEWSLVGTVAAPEKEGVGPGVVEDDGFRSCFAPTPEGALLAAANVVAMGSTELLVPRVTEELTVPGPGREAALERLDEAPAGPPTAAARYQVRGFRMLTYDAGRASVDLALGLDSGVTGSFVLDLRWVEGDWKVLLTDAGTLGTAPAPVPNLAGYTIWSGA